MRLEIRNKDYPLPDAVREEMERRIRFAFGRFIGRISLVTVRLADLNGARGGADKHCRLVARLIPAGKVTIEETHANVAAAVALAADRAGWSINRELKRQRDMRHHRRKDSMPERWKPLDNPQVDARPMNFERPVEAANPARKGPTCDEP